MIKRGQKQLNISRANNSAAEYFGHQPISFKLTSNYETAERAYINKKRRQKHKGQLPAIPFSWWAGVQIPLNRKGRKHLIFVNKKPEMSYKQPIPMEVEEAGFHELFHAYFERYRRSHGKKVYLLGSEMAAHIASLEYLAKINTENYRKGVESPDLRLASIDSVFAKGLSELIHKEFNAVERRQMIEEIKNGHFATRGQVIRWLLRKLRQKNIHNQYVDEIERYQKDD